MKLISRSTGTVYRLKKPFTFGYWKSKMLKRFKPASLFLIEFTHYNGSIGDYVISTNAHKFSFGKYVYIIDEKRKIYNNTAKMNMLRYHEGFALPYDVSITSKDMHKNIPDDPMLSEIATSFNPYVLVDVLKMEYTKGVIQGAEVHDFIKRGMIIALIGALISLGHLMLNAFKSGWI